jgi:glucose/arabinose dehydrogenase
MHRRRTSLLAGAALLAVAACGAEEPEATDPAPTEVSASPEPSSEDPDAATVSAPETTTQTATPTATEEAAPLEPLVVVADSLDVPWGLAVVEDGTAALVGERDTAQVWRVPLEGERELVATVPGVRPDSEGGLLGLVVPPDGDGSQFFVYATTAEDNRVLRIDTSGDEPQVEVVLDGIPKAGNHNGGRLAFGPDGHLYVSTGDALDVGLAQQPGSLGGKILRITEDGDPAPGNPDPDSPVWSLGHRNVQGLGWDSQGRMWASEFGQDALDELNLIEPGANYGWPLYEGPGGDPAYVDPVLTWTTDQASPSGLAVGPDDAIYVAALRGQALWRVQVDADGVAGEPERLLTDHGRLRSVVVDDAGALWVLTSNTFRGSPAEDDDRLLRLDPAELRR